MAQPALQRAQPRDVIVCPGCGWSYEITPGSLGLAGRRVRCANPKCKETWIESDIVPESGAASPVTNPLFARRMKVYLNGLPPRVKRTGSSLTHAIKTFLMREGLGDDAVGYANGIKIDLRRFKNVEFLWDAAAKVANPEYPDEDIDLIFVAESENQMSIQKILEDANKLPIVRADARLMFFRANDKARLDYVFDRLRGLFDRHRKSEPGDVYLLAGLDTQTWTYTVRRLTIRRDGSNEAPWQEVV